MGERVNGKGYEIEKSPRRAAYVERVKTWGTRWWPVVRASFASGRKATAATIATHEKAWP
jgi:hypothetical protein